MRKIIAISLAAALAVLSGCAYNDNDRRRPRGRDWDHDHDRWDRHDDWDHDRWDRDHRR